MIRRWTVPGLAALLVVASRWPFRSQSLFSWDSANFALALEHIDIAAHQPHPPGYLGYVWIARAIQAVVGDPNLSLVIWNIAATVLAALVVMRFAWEVAAESGNRTRTAVIAGLIFASGPLLWFYGTVAEIYPSELLVTLLIAFTAWRALRGVPGAIQWCACAVVVALMVKVSAAVLMLPLVIYAWSRAHVVDRWRSLAIVGAGMVATGALFYTLQPDLPAVVWHQLTTSTSSTRLLDGELRPLRQLNRNLRDVFTALASGLGPVNLLALIVLSFTTRKLPARLDRAVVWLWMAPWLFILLAVHIGKPGYVLPLVPLLVVILASWYVRLGRTLQVTLVGVQLATNIAMFVWVAPSSAVSGNASPYRDRTLAQKMASDLQGLTFPTAHTVAASDQRVTELKELVRTTCAAGNPVIVAGDAGVDWRRVMYYFPDATAIRVSGTTVLSAAHNRRVQPIPESGMTLTTTCPIIRLNDKMGAPVVTPAGTLHVTSAGIVVD